MSHDAMCRRFDIGRSVLDVAPLDLEYDFAVDTSERDATIATAEKLDAVLEIQREQLKVLHTIVEMNAAAGALATRRFRRINLPLLIAAVVVPTLVAVLVAVLTAR